MWLARLITIYRKDLGLHIIIILENNTNLVEDLRNLNEWIILYCVTLKESWMYCASQSGFKVTIASSQKLSCIYPARSLSFLSTQSAIPKTIVIWPLVIPKTSPSTPVSILLTATSVLTFITLQLTDILTLHSFAVILNCLASLCY